MKMMVPKTVGVGSYDYEVVFVPRLSYDYKLLGQSLAESQRIKLEPDTSQQTKAVTFWHEVAHSIDDAYHCGLTEENCDRIAQGIASILQRDFGIEFDWSEVKQVKDDT